MLAIYCVFHYSFLTVKIFTGIPASAGVAIGKALVYTENDIPEIPCYTIEESKIPAERQRLLKAVAEAIDEVKVLHERASREISSEQADIFQAHLLMLEDDDLHEQVRNRLIKSRSNAEWVVWDASREISQKLMLSPEPIFFVLATENTDVSYRLIRCVLGIEHKHSTLTTLNEDVILVAHDLMPSDTLVMDKSRVKGIALDVGSRTCHTAILARAFNIPAVLGLSDFSKEVKDGQIIALNGSSGTIVIDPDRRILAQQKSEEKKQRKQSDQLDALRDLPAQTTDGYCVRLKGNIEFPEEAENVLKFGAEGIGLYRSEFLFIAPGKAAEEETQYEAYSKVLKTMGKLPVTIRTVDLGGDKVIPELQTISEKNPLLGWRAIRLSLANPELFKVQLRAILRASAHGNVRIMFPMISGIEELEQALALLDEARTECSGKGQAFDKNIAVGAMIEIPSAAMTADILAEKTHFFSIGTNDLIQYTVAVDRGNEKVSYLGEPYHPAVLRFLKTTIDAAHKQGIKAAMCGELAGDPSATAILLGLGLDEFSMTASSIPQIKRIIRNTSIASCRVLADECLRGRSITEVRATVHKWTADKAPPV
jgi:phosphotransferase system enzyme I (PtsI)